MILRSISLLSSALVLISAVAPVVSEPALSQTAPAIEGGELGPQIVGGRNQGRLATQEIDVAIGSIGIDALMLTSPELESASSGTILDEEGNEIGFTSSQVSPTTVAVALDETVFDQTITLVIKGIQTRGGDKVTYRLEAQNNTAYPGTWFPVGMITVSAREMGSGR